MKTQRGFIIGDQWLYYKIYTGSKTTDYVLSEVLLPLITALEEQQVIVQWFFLRYRDPEHHLRIRFRYTNPEHIATIINHLHPALKTLLEQDLIWRIQTDTYQRELERYGSNTIELAEELFHYDSAMIAGFVDLIEEGTEGDELRWMFALRGMDEFLKDFDYSMESRLQLLRWLKEDFAQEFHMEKNLKKQVNDRYRNYRNRIDDFMKLTTATAGDYLPLLELLAVRSRKSSTAVKHLLKHNEEGTLEMNINELFASFIHMFMNRLFKSKNRVHEMIGYDFLYRYYMACIARQKKAKAGK